MNGKRIKMRISDIHFREIETSDLEMLLCNDSEYKPQYFIDTVTEEMLEIDLTDWRESLKRLCISPQASLWVQEGSQSPNSVTK